MAREVVEPTTDEEGWERHPAWGMIGASRVSNSHGAVLFDSEIRHGHYVTVRLVAGSRKRDLNRDWLHGEKTIVEVAMSEAQWASFVSSMGVGSGVPCTITFRDSEGGPVAEMPYAPRLQESMDEVRGAADKALEKIREAFEVAKERPNKGNMRNLEFAIKNAPSNMTFAAKSMTEHTENVVQKARADIEAMIVSKAQQLGLEPGDLGITHAALTAGDDEGERP
jgi:hypothetical protein